MKKNVMSGIFTLKLLRYFKNQTYVSVVYMFKNYGYYLEKYKHSSCILCYYLYSEEDTM
jgi:hypothetical protein